MDIYDVTLRHGGRLEMQNRKLNITVPEVAVLREIHGSDAVVEMTRVGKINRGSEKELERLRYIYQPRLAEGPHPVDVLWPGQQQAKLPLQIAQIGINADSPYLGSPGKSVPAEDADNMFKLSDEPFDEDELDGEPDPAPSEPASASLEPTAEQVAAMKAAADAQATGTQAAKAGK